MKLEHMHLVFSFATLAAIVTGYLSVETVPAISPVFWVLFVVILVMNPLVILHTRPWRREISGLSRGTPPILVRVSSLWLLLGLLTIILILAGFALILYAFMTNQLPHG